MSKYVDGAVDDLPANDAGVLSDERHKNLMKKIIEHYGLRAQAKYMMTEIYELIEAILCHQLLALQAGELEESRRLSIAEEIADVYVFLCQFQIFFGIKETTVREMMFKKIERQIKRIEEEKYCDGKIRTDL